MFLRGLICSLVNVRKKKARERERERVPANT